MINRRTGELTQASCERLICSACLPRVALLQSAALALAAPILFITFTQVGDTWPEIRSRMNHWRKVIRKNHPTWHDSYTVEINPNRSGHHVHMYSWGAELLPGEAQRAAARAGLGIVLDEQSFVMEEGARHLAYALKAAFDSAPEIGQAFLAINGGRLLHPTRGFFRDGIDGQQLRGLTAAVRRVR